MFGLFKTNTIIVSGRQGRPMGVESFSLLNLKKGEKFFTHKEDKYITGIATRLGIKVKTRRLVAINNNDLDCQRLTEVTLI